MMTALEITKRILTHEEVYRMAGFPIPPYRLTYEENMILGQYCFETGWIDNKNIKYIPMKRYGSVEIEVVVPLENKKD